MLRITAVEGDITEQQVDAVVNAANTTMRGGGGVDGAIHRAGGPEVLRDCVSRFPDGLAVGDAGWTTAGALPARWVIHTVGPNYNAGERDRSLLESCYRRSLEVADQLGARTVAFPLISTGIFGWPRQDAIAAAVESIAGSHTRVDEVRLVAFDPEMREQVAAKLASWTPLRILQGVRFLHERGYHRLRIMPGLSPSGMHWRVEIVNADNTPKGSPVVDPDSVLQYTTGQFIEFAGGEVTVTSTPESVAELILNALPETVPSEDDPAYVSWFAELVGLCERSMSVPVAYADYFDSSEGWEVGSSVRYPHPPEVPTIAPKGPAPTEQTADGKKKSASRKPLISSEIEALRKQGHSQSEIAAMHGVSRQAVSWQKQTYGGYLTYRQVVNKAWPWKTNTLHGKSKVYQRLRDHGEYMLTQGSGMSEDKLDRLQSWWRKLRNDDLVVEFDPALPPLRGVSPHGGFALRQKVPEDLDLLIRVNAHTSLTEGSRRIWCWPADSAISDLEARKRPDAPQPICTGSAHIYLTSEHKREFLASFDPAEAVEFEKFIIVRE